MILRRFFSARIAAVVLAMATTAAFTLRGDEWDREYMKSLFSGHRLDPIEGIWQFPDDGATIAIVVSSATTYDIFLLDSPKLNVRPGKLIGSAVATPKKNMYDGELRSRDFGKKGKIGNESVTFTVNDNGTISIRPYSRGMTVSFRRWFYKVFGLSLVSNDNRPKDIDGARRVYPYVVSDHYPIIL